MNGLVLLGLLAIGVFTTMYVLVFNVFLSMYNENKKDFEQYKKRVYREYREFEAMANKRMEEQCKENERMTLVEAEDKEEAKKKASEQND